MVLWLGYDRIHHWTPKPLMCAPICVPSKPFFIPVWLIRGPLVSWASKPVLQMTVHWQILILKVLSVVWKLCWRPSRLCLQGTYWEIFLTGSLFRIESHSLTPGLCSLFWTGIHFLTLWAREFFLAPCFEWGLTFWLPGLEVSSWLLNENLFRLLWTFSFSWIFVSSALFDSVSPVRASQLTEAPFSNLLTLCSANSFLWVWFC